MRLLGGRLVRSAVVLTSLSHCVEVIITGVARVFSSSQLVKRTGYRERSARLRNGRGGDDSFMGRSMLGGEDKGTTEMGGEGGRR